MTFASKINRVLEIDYSILEDDFDIFMAKNDEVYDMINILSINYGIMFQRYSERDIENEVIKKYYNFLDFQIVYSNESDIPFKFLTIEAIDKPLRDDILKEISKHLDLYTSEKLIEIAKKEMHTNPKVLMFLLLGTLDDVRNILKESFFSENPETREWSILAVMRNPAYWQEFYFKIIQAKKDSSENVRKTAQEMFAIMEPYL